MIIHAIFFFAGCVCGIAALALYVIATEAERVGRPPRRKERTDD